MFLDFVFKQIFMSTDASCCWLWWWVLVSFPLLHFRVMIRSIYRSTTFSCEFHVHIHRWTWLCNISQILDQRVMLVLLLFETSCELLCRVWVLKNINVHCNLNTVGVANAAWFYINRCKFSTKIFNEWFSSVTWKSANFAINPLSYCTLCNCLFLKIPRMLNVYELDMLFLP